MFRSFPPYETKPKFEIYKDSLQTSDSLTPLHAIESLTIIGLIPLGLKKFIQHNDNRKLKRLEIDVDFDFIHDPIVKYFTDSTLPQSLQAINSDSIEVIILGVLGNFKSVQPLVNFTSLQKISLKIDNSILPQITSLLMNHRSNLSIQNIHLKISSRSLFPCKSEVKAAKTFTMNWTNLIFPKHTQIFALILITQILR